MFFLKVFLTITIYFVVFILYFLNDFRYFIDSNPLLTIRKERDFHHQTITYKLFYFTKNNTLTSANWCYSFKNLIGILKIRKSLCFILFSQNKKINLEKKRNWTETVVFFFFIFLTIQTITFLFSSILLDLESKFANI